MLNQRMLVIVLSGDPKNSKPAKRAPETKTRQNQCSKIILQPPQGVIESAPFHKDSVLSIQNFASFIKHWVLSHHCSGSSSAPLNPNHKGLNRILRIICPLHLQES